MQSSSVADDDSGDKKGDDDAGTKEILCECILKFPEYITPLRVLMRCAIESS